MLKRVYKVTSRASVFYSAKRPTIRQGSDIPPIGGQGGEFHAAGGGNIINDSMMITCLLAAGRFIWKR
jgi:hypothetical protein